MCQKATGGKEEMGGEDLIQDYHLMNFAIELE